MKSCSSGVTLQSRQSTVGVTARFEASATRWREIYQREAVYETIHQLRRDVVLSLASSGKRIPCALQEVVVSKLRANDNEEAMRTPEEIPLAGKLHTSNYLNAVGVPDIPPLTSPFDPGYDPLALESHLDQSSHLMSILKISMACWLVAREASTRRKVAAAKRHEIPTVTGGGPFEIATAQGVLPDYLDLCADIGFTRIECAQGFTDLPLKAEEVVAMARERGLEVQFELGKKHAGPFTEQTVNHLVEQGHQWLDAGALQLVVEARESAQGVGLFNEMGDFNPALADRFAEAFGLNAVMFEAPNKPSQFALLDHFGREVHLCNVRLEEILRVEIYRRGLHSDSFTKQKLRPIKPAETHPAGAAR